jgi:hypothetical protein
MTHWLTLFAALAAPISAPLVVQGALTDADGTTATGARSVTFTLYDAASGGGEVYAETTTAHLVDGAFAVALGGSGGVPEAAYDAASGLWLTVTLDGVESDRTPIGVAPLAGRAATADMADDAAKLGGIGPSGWAPAADGAVVLAGSTAGCSETAHQGRMRWNGTAFEGCTSSGWVALAMAPDVTAVNSAVTAQGTSIASLQAALTALTSTVDGHTTSITGLNSSYGTLNGTVSGLNTTVGGLNTTVGGLSTTVGTLSTTVSGHTTSLSTQAANITQALSGRFIMKKTMPDYQTVEHASILNFTEVPFARGLSESTNGIVLKANKTYLLMSEVNTYNTAGNKYLGYQFRLGGSGIGHAAYTQQSDSTQPYGFQAGLLEVVSIGGSDTELLVVIVDDNIGAGVVTPNYNTHMFVVEI